MTEPVVVREFHSSDLETVVSFWNRAFADQPNFRPTSADEFRGRVLDCALFDPRGFLLAWAGGPGGAGLVGLAHALRPAPAGPERSGEGHHFLALLHVDPAFRRQGIGSRLLKAAETYLYYCPVYVGAEETPCYGWRDGRFAPLFGPSGVPALGVGELDAINFFAHRGYLSLGLGDVTLTGPKEAGGAVPNPQDVLTKTIPSGLNLVEPNQAPPVFKNRTGLAVVDESGQSVGEIRWTALGPTRWAILDWRVDEAWWGRGLGRALLDGGLARMRAARPDADVEIRVHWDRHRRAVEMLNRRGFGVDGAWASLVKT
jgi:ribosomal protein S18 acetylase RimI-like enzyme